MIVRCEMSNGSPVDTPATVQCDVDLRAAGSAAGSGGG